MELAFKSKGTQLLNLERYTDAIDKYTESLNIMNQRINRNEITTERQMFDLIDNIKLPCLRNISLCYLRLNSWADCAITCDLVLEIDAECAKSWYRKTYSLIQMGQLSEAEAALKKVEQFSPESNWAKALRTKIDQKNRDINTSLEQSTPEFCSRQFNPSSSCGQTLLVRVLGLVVLLISLPLALLRFVLNCSKQCVSLAKSMFAKCQSIFNNTGDWLCHGLQKVFSIVMGPANMIYNRVLHSDLPLYSKLSGHKSIGNIW